MKQKLLKSLRLRACMLVALLCAGVSAAWGESGSIEINTTNSGVTGSYQDKEFDVNDITFKFTQWMKNTNIQAKKSTTNSCYNIDAIPGTITSIVVVQTGTARAITIYGGTSEKPTDQITSPATAATMTFDFTGKNYNYFSLTTPGNACYFDKITINYTTGGSATDPSIEADNVDIAYDATSGYIAYTIKNPTSETLSATTTSDWLTLGTVGASPIHFTCSANTTNAARTAVVTLTYGTATKNVKVTQAANPNVVDKISDITAAGTYAVQGTIVAKSQRGFVVGDGTGYVYYYNQDYTQSDYNIGDKVKLSGSVVVYGGVFEFNNTATVTAVTESNYVAEEPTVLTGAQMDSRVASTTPTQLSNYVQFEGTLSVSGTHYNITNIDGATTAVGSISYPLNTDFTSLADKTVKVTGYFVGISSSTYYNTMLGSIEEVVDATPIIDANDVTLAYDATSGEIPYKVNNPVDGQSLTATTTAEWISNIQVGEGSVTFTTTQNDGTANRTATITLAYEGAESVEVTVTQKFYVADYATLPFKFNGGKADIETTAGLTESGLGSDYNSAPKLKFDHAGDELVLKFNERPGKLTFDVKGNPGGSPSVWNAVFKVQTSTDGANFTDLATYNDLEATTSTIEFDELGAEVRYIKWVYTEKVSGNVALGNITLAQYSEGQGGEEPITGDKYVKVTSTADITDGEYLIVYEGGSLAFNGGLETLDAVSNTIAVTIENDEIAATDATDAAVFTIDVTAGTLKSASGKYIGVSSNSNGLKQTDEASTYTNGFSIDDDGNAVISAVFEGSTMTLKYNKTSGQTRFRYFKSGQEAIQLFKKVSAAPETVTVTIGASATGADGAYYSSVYYSDKALKVPAGVECQTYKMTDGKLTVSKTYAAGSVVPAGQAVVIKASASGEVTFTVTSQAGEADTESQLLGVDEATKITETGFKYYKLTLNSSSQTGTAGFYFDKNSNGGTQINAAAHKCYLRIPAAQAAKSAFVFGEETTGINAVSNEQMATDKVYNLSGQRVQKATKGIYIVNGKKVVMK